jgi:NAD(P)-dependent dehydrogenase (short-subunit alcohol dehydrogenase family)
MSAEARPPRGQGRLAEKVALVTGAGSRGPGLGNGKATAILFAREGAHVLCVDMVKERAEETVGLIRADGGSAEAFAAVGIESRKDLSKPPRPSGIRCSTSTSSRRCWRHRAPPVS